MSTSTETIAEGIAASPFEEGLDQLLAGLAYIDLRIRWAVARARAAGLDPSDEFRGLYISDEQVDTLLNQELGQHLWSTTNGQPATAALGAEAGDGQGWPDKVAAVRRQWQQQTEASRRAGFAMRFDRLVRAFDLSPPEVDALLIALAPELDPRYERLFAYLQDDVTRKRPSVDLVLNLLAGAFREKLRLRRLFNDDGRLLRSRLLVRSGDGSESVPFLAQTVQPAARVVHHLVGETGLDSRLQGSGRLLAPDELPAPFRLPRQLRQRLVDAARPEAGAPPIFVLVGAEGVGRQEAAHHLARAANNRLIVVDAGRLAGSDVGLQEGLRLVLRDGRLLDAHLHLHNWQDVLDEGRFPRRAFQRLLDYPRPITLASTREWQPGHGLRERPVYTLSLESPPYERRLQLWRACLSQEEQAAVDLAQIANHFRFTAGQIESASATARDRARWRGRALSTDDLFTAARLHSNQKLSELATKIEPRYGWHEIVLPEDSLRQLRELANTVRRRPTVYGEWGFGRKLALGKGVNALFAGESGTGKTMAADIIAGELGLDLYKVDLSTVVSKYIGETEKNLDRIFSEAATSNAILFFDEADALFGKRSEVKDSHDRYANIEVSYLLQRMEAYDGVVIMATNLRANIDEAFTRRLHFVVEFPFPDKEDRERIWRVNFPEEAPLAPGVDFGLLARRFELAGGNIRNIILAAAFLAAESDSAVEMSHLLHAARREYQKMGRLIDESLFN